MHQFQLYKGRVNSDVCAMFMSIIKAAEIHLTSPGRKLKSLRIRPAVCVLSLH